MTRDETAGALERAWNGDWTPRSLPALAITADGGTVDRALNDFVVVRGGPAMSRPPCASTTSSTRGSAATA